MNNVCTTLSCCRVACVDQFSLFQMFYDPERNVLIDADSGCEIPVSDNDVYPPDIKRQIQEKKDRDFALSLSQSDYPNKLTQTAAKYVSSTDDSPNEYESKIQLAIRRRQEYLNLPTDGEMKMQQELIDMRLHESEQPSSATPESQGGWMDDLTLARALQAMEFEIAAENERGPDRGDFDEKEYRASSCKRQMLTVSTLILLIQAFISIITAWRVIIHSIIFQIGLVIAMVQDDGYAPRYENPLIGPPSTTMVQASFSFISLSHIRCM
jgi:hypothetical protein